MSKFKVGDRVVLVNHSRMEFKPKMSIGECGTIVVADRTGYGLCFDKYVGGHDLDGACPNGHGWWVWEEHIDFLVEEGDFEPVELQIKDLFE